MSSEGLHRNFQIFLQSIYDWPSPTIEKSALITKLEQLCRQNPELEHIYENVPMLPIRDLNLTRNPDDPPLSPRKIYHNPPLFPPNDNNFPTVTNGNHTGATGSNLLQNIILVKEGDISVRKGSVVLSPLLKKYGFKSPVYCELSYTFSDNKKTVYFSVYQNRKCRKLIHKFVIDSSCSFVLEHKKDFLFKHNSLIEKLTTETGVADAWILSFDEANMVRQENVDSTESEYENPADLLSDYGSSSLDSTRETPPRPPPLPSLPTNSISPEKIYVCLYNHRPTSKSNELDFNCGDLLYIIDATGPNFYIGYRLTLPLTSFNHTRKGIVFKDFITPAYEKVS